MKSSKFLIFPAVVGLFFLTQFADAQTAENWVKLEHQKSELSVMMPEGFLVDKVSKQQTVLHGYENGASMQIRIKKTGNAKTELETMRRFRTSSEAKISSFTIDDFSGDLYTYDTADTSSVQFYIAAPKSFYQISVSSKNQTNLSALKFINSIHLNGKPVILQAKPPATDNMAATKIESLTTNPVITEALKKKNGGTFIDEIVAVPEKTEAEKNINYSRQLIVLRRPAPSYTDSARADNITGSVKLKLQFKADGDIGTIQLVQKLDSGLEKEAVKAARKIKFLPAQIDGKNVEVYKVVVFQFTIY